jgi:hypothetical protein
MTRAVFVVSKHPFGPRQDGETVVTQRLLEAAAEGASVRAVALSERSVGTSHVKVIEVPKPRVRLARLGLSSISRRRSLIHERFAPPQLRGALERVDADVLVARRAYMAEAAIDAGRVPPRTGLAILVDVLESMVMRMRGGPLAPALAFEARRTRRDELRCARAGSAVAYFSEVERRELGDAPDGPRLDLTLEPAGERSRLEDPVALFIGDRTWPPNAHALETVERIWPGIAARAPGARLLIVGSPGPRENPPPAGAERLGYVDGLDAVWRSAGVLLAPIRMGGGVRVKILDAASHGVAVVGTEAAVGSTGSYLPIRAHDSEEEFASEAARLLSDRRARVESGEVLYEANRELHESGFVESQIADLIAAAT